MTSINSMHPLSRWINPVYLQADSLTLKRDEFHSSPERLAILDNFLLPGAIKSLQYFFDSEANYRPMYRLASKVERVDSDTWFSAPDTDRFYKHHEVVGIEAKSRMSKHAISYLIFRRVISESSFVAIFNTIANNNLHLGPNGINAKCYRYGDFLRPHTDAIGDRVLCGNLYLSADWNSDYGGQFGLYNHETGQTINIEPVCNRLVVFDPQKEFKHWINPINQKAGDAKRFSISFWYNTL